MPRASAFMPPALTLNKSFQLCSLPVSRLHFLCQALCNPYCKIKDLRLIFCHLTASCGRDLSSVFETNHYLTDLEFVKSTLEDSGMKLLCEGLKHPNCVLQTLSLSTCHLTDASCVELSSFLQVNQTLKELFMFANVLGDTGVQHLCKGLQHTKGVIENLVIDTDHLREDTFSKIEVLKMSKPGIW
ncbi:NACHT, LRR and PYD domains-containing protein 12 [Callithrix jacchus]